MIGSCIIIATLLLVYLMVDGVVKSQSVSERKFGIYEHPTCFPCGFEFVLDHFQGGERYDCKVTKVLQNECTAFYEVRNQGVLWYSVVADFDQSSSVNIVMITDELTGCCMMLDFSACDSYIKQVFANVLLFGRLFYDEREVLWCERGRIAPPPKGMKVIFLN